MFADGVATLIFGPDVINGVGMGAAVGEFTTYVLNDGFVTVVPPVPVIDGGVTATEKTPGEGVATCTFAEPEVTETGVGVVVTQVGHPTVTAPPVVVAVIGLEPETLVTVPAVPLERIRATAPDALSETEGVPEAAVPSTRIAVIVAQLK